MYDIELDDHDRLATHVARLIDACEQYSDEQKEARECALEYYNGEMNDLIADDGRSSVVSKDVRSVVKRLMPSIMRTILSNDKIVEYQPISQDDEQSAEQATDYINHVVVPECGAEQAIYDSVFDALLIKTGILKWVAYKRKQTKIYEFTNQPSSALLGLEGESGIEVIEQEDLDETDKDVLALEPDAKRHNFKIRRIEEKVDVKLEAIPRGSFLIHPGSMSIEESPIVGERQIVTRSELVSRGFDKQTIAELSEYEITNDDHDDRWSREGEDWSDIRSQTSKAMQQVLIYEVYVRLDQDKDGIAELYKMCIAERSGNDEQKHQILDMEAVSEIPYADVVIEREAHQFEGHSLAEDVQDIQKIKTALLRSTLDNVYWQNNLQPAIQEGGLTESGLEAVYNPEFGKVITVKPGLNVTEAVQWMQVPVIADKSFGMMDYFDSVIQDRTGVTDQSGGIDPEAFQNMTATSAQIMSESGIAQAEMIIRSLARGGIRKAFRGLLKLVIAHADKPRTVRLRGKWVEYDPRHWNVDMDCTVNVGLGAGSKERDLSILQIILGLQRELIASIGADNPYVKPDQLYNTLEKITETAGFPSAQPYFTQPDLQEIAAKMQQQSESAAQAEQQKMQVEVHKEEIKANARSKVEIAQMEADLAVRAKEHEYNVILENNKNALAQQARLLDEKKLVSNETIKNRELSIKLFLDLLKMDVQIPENLQNMAIDFGGEHIDATQIFDELRNRPQPEPEPDPTAPLVDAANRLAEMTGVLADGQQKMYSAANAPKQVIRDENGNVIGVKPMSDEGNDNGLS